MLSSLFSMSLLPGTRFGLPLPVPLRSLLRPAAVAAMLLGLVWGTQAGVSGRLRTPRADVATYTVKPGDNLTTVAAKFSVSVKELASANRITNHNVVWAGAKLTIPDAASSAAAPSASSSTSVPAKVKAATVKGGGVSSKLPAALLAKPERLALIPTFEKWAKTYGVEPELMQALAWMESGWQNDAVSSVSAKGIGQLMPDTVKFVSENLLRERMDVNDPDDNIRMSARYMAYLLDRTDGDSRQALAAYYQGLGSLRRFGMLAVSKLYVDDIMALRIMFS